MHRTRLSLIYLMGYLYPTGLLLYFAPQWTLKLLLSNQPYSDDLAQFSGILLVGLGIVVTTVFLYGGQTLYRMTLILRSVLWLGIFGIYLHSRNPFFIVVLVTVGVGMLLTGTIYFLERRDATIGARDGGQVYFAVLIAIENPRRICNEYVPDALLYGNTGCVSYDHL